MDIPSDDLGERIPSSLLKRNQQPVRIIVDGNGLTHALIMHESTTPVNVGAEVYMLLKQG
jgi:hypothetical protein